MSTATYIPRLYDFLRRLGANNNRQWFADNKEEYIELRGRWMEDLDRLIGAMTAYEPRLAGQSARTSAYRIYRDTRFSPDKTPYKTYFSAAISPYGKSAEMAGYYFNIGYPADHGQGLYGGIWCPSAPVLKKLRRAIVDNIEEFREIISEPRLARLAPGWCGEALKTIPKGWDRNHPDADLLRLKEYGKFIPAGEDFFSSPDATAHMAEHFRLFKPLIDFINYSIEEE